MFYYCRSIVLKFLNQDLCNVIYNCKQRKLSVCNILYNISCSDIAAVNKSISDPAGLVLGIFTGENGEMKLSPTAEKFNDKLQGKLLNIMKSSTFPNIQLADVRVLYGVDTNFPAIVLAGVGSECAGYNITEIIDERKEGIRTGIGAGVKKLLNHNITKIFIDSCTHAESAAEGAALGTWCYQELRREEKQFKTPKLSVFDCCDHAGWRIGLEKAAAQNLARQLQETPRNSLTPTTFAQTTVEILSQVGINVEVKMKNWTKLRNLHAYLAVAKGSCEQPVFLQTLYEGCNPDICPIVLIGKGTTHNSGGLCLKSCKEIDYMRGDMSGAACVVATLKAVASLNLPINIRALIPLVENSLGASAYKPGDIYSAINTKTIKIENTSAEGVLMLADAINYAKEFNPKFILDIGTLTPGIRAGLGSAAAGVYCNNESLYETLQIASIHTGDRIWRMPLWEYFSEYIRDSKVSDLTNYKTPKNIGEPSNSAAFLREFVPNNIDWIHIDNYGVMGTNGKEFTYLSEGMSGRPTRTLIEFIAQLVCHDSTNAKQKAAS